MMTYEEFSSQNCHYVVIRDGKIVQEIFADGADQARSLKTETGVLYLRVGMQSPEGDPIPFTHFEDEYYG